MSDFSDVFDKSAQSTTRDRRQLLGAQLVFALHALLRNARSHAGNNAVFGPVYEGIEQTCRMCVSTGTALSCANPNSAMQSASFNPIP